MTLVDRFICRRLGHQPMFTVTMTTVSGTYLTICQRCGKWIELDLQAGAEDPVTLKKAGDQSDSS
jgi:transcription elongation factor Elf1